MGHPGDRAAAELPQRRAARGRPPTACSSARWSCSWSSRSSGTCSSSATGTSCSCTPTRRSPTRSAALFVLLSVVRVPRHRGRDRRPVQARVAAAAAGDAARASPGSRACSSSRSRNSASSAPLAWLAVSLAAGHPGGVPRRPAALAARARRRRRPVRRDPDDARRASCRRGWRRRPATRASSWPTGSRGRLRRRRRRAGRAAARGRRASRRSTAARWSTTPRSTRTPALVEVVAAAAAIALEHEQLEAESRASRQRLVAAGDAERRRLERDLHDGAQQRLVDGRDPAAADRGRHPPRPGGGGGARDERERRARPLAGGAARAGARHPSRPCSSTGSASALTSLAARSAVPTAVSCDPLGDAARGRSSSRCTSSPARRWPTSPSTRRRRPPRSGSPAPATASRSRSPTTASAAPRAARGSGLRGLQDRVEALAGHLLVTSPAGAGTVVSAELPCAS